VGQGWFVTGTDTGVGKTRISEALIRSLARAGFRAAGMKPVASGAVHTPQGLRSSDAEALLAASSVPLTYADVNPYVFAPATAPHLAARQSGAEIRIDEIQRHFRAIAAQADHVIVEGVGGWQVPIGPRFTMADVVVHMQWPVILVVGIRLGAINHALLTVDAIHRCGCRLAGWVANLLDPDPLPGYVETLTERLSTPLLGIIPFGTEAGNAVDHLNLNVFTRSAS